MLKPRPDVLAIPKYRAPESSRYGLRLDFNESTMGCSPRVLARLRSLAVDDIAYYTGREKAEKCAAEFLGVRSDALLLTNGVDEAIHLLCAAYLSPGDVMLTLSPTFSMYEVNAIACGAGVQAVSLGKDYRFPIEAVVDSISANTKLICIASPNNPTGTTAPQSDLRRLLHAFPSAAFLIDEAYFEFCGQTCIDQAGKLSNLFVARTFSKAYGLAGLRIGALCGPAPQMDTLRRTLSPFNVNNIALACLPDAIADQDFVSNCVAETARSREMLQAAFGQLGIPFIPSSANFVLAFFGERRAEVLRELEREEIFVRDRDAECGHGAIRISLGTQIQTQRVIGCLSTALSKPSVAGARA